jgi:hypothetical protein
MTTARARWAQATLLLSCCLPACSDQIRPLPAGDRIAGHVRYDGAAYETMSRPGVLIAAAYDFPPSAQPYGLLTVERPNLAAELKSTGVPYEIAWLSPFTYKVYGQLIDLDASLGDVARQPAGGYPDFCTLPRAGEGLVTVTESAAATGIDFVLYDGVGAEDPCAAAATICPPPGKSTMNLTVVSTQASTASDQLRVALFQTWPSTMPASIRLAPGSGLTFPHTVTDNGLNPGSYALLYACLDVGSNAGLGLCTSEDFDAVYQPPDPALSFPADTIVNLVADLDLGTISVVSIVPSASAGCP